MSSLAWVCSVKYVQRSKSLTQPEIQSHEPARCPSPGPRAGSTAGRTGLQWWVSVNQNHRVKMEIEEPALGPGARDRGGGGCTGRGWIKIHRTLAKWAQGIMGTWKKKAEESRQCEESEVPTERNLNWVLDVDYELRGGGAACESAGVGDKNGPWEGTGARLQSLTLNQKVMESRQKVLWVHGQGTEMTSFFLMVGFGHSAFPSTQRTLQSTRCMGYSVVSKGPLSCPCIHPVATLGPSPSPSECPWSSTPLRNLVTKWDIITGQAGEAVLDKQY